MQELLIAEMRSQGNGTVGSGIGAQPGVGRTNLPQERKPPTLLCESSNASLTAAAGIFGKVKFGFNRVLSAHAEINLFKFNIPIIGPETGPRPPGTATFPITQSVGVSLELFGFPIGLVAERRSDRGDPSNEKWDFGAQFHDVNVSDQAVNWEGGVGLFLGGDVSVPLISPAC
jgi:hypothetical protein